MIRDSIKKMLPKKTVFEIQQRKYEHQHQEDWKLVSGNDCFKNIHTGKRCFIIGNGPSVNHVPFAVLSEEYTFTVNQLIRRKDFPELRTNYHMWADERFFDLQENRPEDMELLSVMRSVNTPGNKPTVFYKTAAKAMIDQFELEKELKIAYFMDMCRAYSTPELELPFDHVLPRFPTVIHYLILLAVYMGFTEIFLLGCDCTGIINTVQSRLRSEKELQYGYQISENERKRMQRSNTTFSIQDELRSYADIFDQYELLKQYCDLRKVSLYNATKGSLLESVPKVSLEEVLKK